MIGTLLRIGFLNLRRDRVAQALTFLLPIMFFSIFALIFGHQRNAMQRVHLPVVDEDHSDYSQRLVKALSAEPSLIVETRNNDDDPNGRPLTRADAAALIKAGNRCCGVVLPAGLGASSGLSAFRSEQRPAVQILADVSDPVAPPMVSGLLQKVSFTAAPDTMAREGVAMFERYSGPLTPAQKQATDTWLKQLTDRAPGDPAAPSNDSPFGLKTTIVNVLQPTGGSTATVSFYAAGIGVMFLLFSASGAGGGLLDEEESGTLGRLIGSQAGMTGVLAGKWILVMLVGVAQLCVMFLWGAAVFGLPLFSHLPGFFVMTITTAGAAAAFGLLLATICRSRQQLSGISTIVILAMSATGGSMFPRFLMSETMQKIGLVTFNAWSLDGYLKVFWRELPITALWPQVSVLVGLTVVFLTAGRLFARRWEAL
jgi:ABC-2 type transport system permease protein